MSVGVRPKRGESMFPGHRACLSIGCQAAVDNNRRSRSQDVLRSGSQSKPYASVNLFAVKGHRVSKPARIAAIYVPFARSRTFDMESVSVNGHRDIVILKICPRKGNYR